MAIYQISAGDFRNNQASAFDLADKGLQVIIRRGRRQSYMLLPITDDDICISPAMEQQIRKARREYKKGEYVECDTIDELHNYLEQL